MDNNNNNNNNNMDYDKLRTERKKNYDDFIGGDKYKLNRYKEWSINGNSDYKPYIYDDLSSGNKDNLIKFWHNDHQLKNGKQVDYDTFINTPIKLYRATNKNEDDDETTPFFSYAVDRKNAERFLDPIFRSNNQRSGQIKKLEVKPGDTFGMLPSDENEIIIPNPKYQRLVKLADYFGKYNPFGYNSEQILRSFVNSRPEIRNSTIKFLFDKFGYPRSDTLKSYINNMGYTDDDIISEDEDSIVFTSRPDYGEHSFNAYDKKSDRYNYDTLKSSAEEFNKQYDKTRELHNSRFSKRNRDYLDEQEAFDDYYQFINDYAEGIVKRSGGKYDYDKAFDKAKEAIGPFWWFKKNSRGFKY